MLAAVASNDDRALETFKLVLILSAQDQPASESLREYFSGVLDQAKAILEDPQNAAVGATSEAVILAMLMANDEELGTALADLPTEGRIERSAAITALSTLESNRDAKYQFANSGEEIRSVI